MTAVAKETPAQDGPDAPPESSAFQANADLGDGSAGATPRPEQDPEIAPVGRDWSKVFEPTEEFKAKIAAVMRDVPYDDGEQTAPWDDPADHKREVWTQTWRTSLEKAYVPELADLKVVDLDADQKPKALLRFVERLGPSAPLLNLVITGGVGAGKTAAAVAAGNFAVERGLMARFVRHSQYLAMLRPDGSPVDLPDWQIRRRYRDCDLLVLDDLGAGLDADREASRFVVEETLGLIGDRISAGRATIYTTNEKPDVLALMLGERVLSRMSEFGHVVTLTHADRRGRLAW